MEITPTGENLSIIIDCDYVPHHDWMTKVSVFSIQQHLPDANISINCKRNICKYQLFDWTRKLNIRFTYNENKQKECLIITPDVMAIRTFIDKKIFLAKEEEICTFVTYKEGCGNFVMSEWIDSIEAPFAVAKEFVNNSLSVNEAKILQFWKFMDVHKFI